MKNLFTGEIINKGDLHERLVVSLPNVGEDYAIYNAESCHKFGKVNSNIRMGKLNHVLLISHRFLDEESIRYLVNASVYGLFSGFYSELNSALDGQKDLSDSDKRILDEYIDRQVKILLSYSEGLDLSWKFDKLVDNDIDCHLYFYRQPFCSLEYKDRRLVVKVNGKEKVLPYGLLIYIDLVQDLLNEDLIEMIVRHELYLEYGLDVPSQYKFKSYKSKRIKKVNFVKRQKYERIRERERELRRSRNL